MVGATGIEPVTPAMSRQCSTAELRAHRRKCGRLHRCPSNGKYAGATGRDVLRCARYDAAMEFSPVIDHEALDCRLPARQTAPVVVASPHSGSAYPALFL